jgi:Double-GTPase 2
MPNCKLTNCPVAKDGRCLEGRGETCPNLIPATASAEMPRVVEDAPIIKTADPANFENLPRAAPLEINEARFYSRRGGAKVIAFAGMPDCGKTSLLARLLQLFQGGPVAGFDFAGSCSLPRFEELNWLSTVESCVIQPKMLHSSTHFDNCSLHLAVRSTNGGYKVDLLFNDIAGETFKMANAAQSTCDKLLLLARADHLVVLVDGAALADRNQRHLHKSHVHDFLIRVTQSNQCGAHTALQVVIAKWDKLDGNVILAESLEAEVNGSFKSKFGSIQFARIAARPMNGSLPTIEPIEKLFAALVQTTHRHSNAFSSELKRKDLKRDFCRFGIFN